MNFCLPVGGQGPVSLQTQSSVFSVSPRSSREKSRLLFNSSFYPGLALISISPSETCPLAILVCVQGKSWKPKLMCNWKFIVKSPVSSHNTIKVLEENIGRKILDIPRSNILTDTSPKARDIKERINKWDLIKIKSFCMAKENSIKIKREPTVWENIFANVIFYRNQYKWVIKMEAFVMVFIPLTERANRN